MKKNSSNDRIDRLISCYGRLTRPRTDAGVAAGILAIHTWLRENPSASLINKHQSLLCALRREVDPAFHAFTLAIGFPPFCFSEELLARRTGTIDLIKQGYRRLLDSVNSENDCYASVHLEQKFPGYKNTIDTMVDLIYLCCAINGPTETIVNAYRYKEDVQYEISPGKKQTRKTKNKTSHIPTHRMFDDTGIRLCELCGNMTAYAQELVEVQNLPLRRDSQTEKGLKALSDGARLSLSKFSSTHCVYHSSDGKKNAAYRRGLRRLELYYATRGLLILFQQINKIGVNLLVDRSVSFAIVDNCPDMNIVKGIPNLLDKYSESGSDIGEDEEQDKEVVDHANLLFSLFENSGHPLSKITQSYRSGDPHIYLKALELNLIPQNVDDHLAIVWPAMYRMLENEECIFL